MVRHAIPKLVEQLAFGGKLGIPAHDITLKETHSSFVILSPTEAFKLKKCVNFGFEDFSTLSRRLEACLAELRLNKRTAPDLYCDVLAVTGSEDDLRVEPFIANSGQTPCEFLVHMKRFDGVLAENWHKLDNAVIDSLVFEVANLHRIAAISSMDDLFGAPEQILKWFEDNFRCMLPLCAHLEAQFSTRVQSLRERCIGLFQRSRNRFVDRKKSGYIRECHGDLHLGNVAIYNEKLVLFDCLEFNAELRWCDVMSDVAFVLMDLFDHKLHELAFRFLNNYVQATSDYDGLSVVRLYVIDRALIRAKCAMIRMAQGCGTATDAELCCSLLTLAERMVEVEERPCPVVVMTHGLSGSGKSYVSEKLCELSGCIRIRSDVVRKNLIGQSPGDGTLYSVETTDKTYAKLISCAQQVVQHGWSVVLDATFLQRKRRDLVRAAFCASGVSVHILDVHCADATIRARLQARVGDVSDATTEVYEAQLNQKEDICRDEEGIFIDTSDMQLKPSYRVLIDRIFGLSAFGHHIFVNWYACLTSDETNKASVI
eukprot:TRINITY_DN2195_c0_g1_i1.p1 TRINITY_DN2195_c0_g1~~TRINITY_DN2195_c0_g1_i1.p1  ORF type:complete len:542 (+),score=67.30 TRINITY_DN2195_c0_g1_i1:1938-3563(+)